MRPKSILFRVDANATIGWGHFYRSLALAQMLTADFTISFAVADPLSQIKEILIEKGFELIALPALDYTSPDARGNSEFECDLHGHLQNTDIVVTDGYWFQKKYRSGLRKENVKIVVIEDDGKGEYDADLIINHAPGLNKSNYAALPSTKFALGLEYVLLRPEFIDAAKESTNTLREKEQVLICFGGADAQGLSIKMANRVLEDTSYSVNLIISPTHRQIAEAIKLTETYRGRITVDGNLNALEMVAAMKKAYFGIVPASGILYECLACRLPTITGYYAENQKNIYAGIKNQKAIIPADDFRDFKLSTENLSAKLAEIQNIQPRLIDGNSGERMRLIFKHICHA